MPRTKRISRGETIFHGLNRSVARNTLFQNDAAHANPRLHGHVHSLASGRVARNFGQMGRAGLPRRWFPREWRTQRTVVRVVGPLQPLGNSQATIWTGRRQVVTYPSSRPSWLQRAAASGERPLFCRGVARGHCTVSIAARRLQSSSFMQPARRFITRVYFARCAVSGFSSKMDLSWVRYNPALKAGLP
jgi:hypothetical protein